ncbi:MAG: bifunctional DNA-formamidopyrimidine glycosylase/DNA-(apurinic or apyrimidinic site) lyase [Pyrinomonadaceae bacterium]
MPELPEVELIARSLERFVTGRTITSAKLLRQRLAPDVSPEDFGKHLQGRTIRFVHRRGKHILIDLTGDVTLIVHLRMSGRFSILPTEKENPKFTHAAFHFEDGERLVFDDQRHFGLMKIVDTPSLREDREIKKLGPEPFSEEFSIDYFGGMLRLSRRTLKEFLLDQTKVVGVGNIYASEALFAAGVHPSLPAHRLSKPKIIRLRESILAVLSDAISFGAALDVDPENLEGSYFSSGGEHSWSVYDREKQPCRNCNEPIARLKQGGRSTYFCRKCQRR